MEKIYNVPQEFMDMSVIKYPPHQKSKNIEAKVYEEIIKNFSKLNSQLIYLPIQWTNYFVKNQYGKNISELQNYLDSLPSNNKYFSVVQYAGGPLIEKDNVVFFGAGGFFNTKLYEDSSYIDIPLISDSHNIREFKKNKKYLASYQGRRTHPIRDDIVEIFSKKNNFYVRNLKTMDISYIDSIRFKRIMRNSLFSLCPRGYGPTSFRLYESIQLGSIPVYIAEEDEHILPYPELIDWEKLCVIEKKQNIKNLEAKLLSIFEKNEHHEKLKYGEYCLKNFFNHEFIANEIIKTVNQY